MPFEGVIKSISPKLWKKCYRGMLRMVFSILLGHLMFVDFIILLKFIICDFILVSHIYFYTYFVN